MIEHGMECGIQVSNKATKFMCVFRICTGYNQLHGMISDDGKPAVKATLFKWPSETAVDVKKQTPMVFPTIGWLMKKEFFFQKPSLTGFYDDRWD